MIAFSGQLAIWKRTYVLRSSGVLRDFNLKKHIFCNPILTPLISRCLQTKSTQETTRNVSKKLRHEHSSQLPNPFKIDLPKYRVPPLQQTLDKYFVSLRPFLNQGELKHTRKLLDAFSRPGGNGEALQEILEVRAKKQINWMEDWWLHKTYLEPRCPVPVNVSPGIVFPHQHYSTTEGQLRTAASFVEHMLQFRDLINSGQLEPDSVSGRPVCMDQYTKLFGSYRVPGSTHDEIIVGEQQTDMPFFVVMYRNTLYQVPTNRPSGEPLSHHEIYLYLHSAVTQAHKHPTPPVGILTSQDRTSWSHVHKVLHKNKHNRWLLDRIQKSLFVLCLDSECPHKNGKSSVLTRAGRQILHGNGSMANSANRWFDKTLQLIVGTDGVCGWNYEHTLIEGPPLFRMMEYIVTQHSKSTLKHGAGHAALTRDSADAKAMLWDLDESLLTAIDTAAIRMNALVGDVDLEVMEFKDFGKNFIKGHKLSPDSFFQMAIQLAFYRLYNQIPPTYESGSLRQFARGRTETIRSASEESSNFVKAIVSNAGPKTVRENLTKAVNAHKKYAAEASSGNGVDRHLLGLKLAAMENGIDVPAFLVDSGYTTSTHWKLSTSQGNSVLPAFMCYGPAVVDGYGCCYNPMDDQIIAGISAVHSFTATDARKFAETVKDSLIDMKNVLEKS